MVRALSPSSKVSRNLSVTGARRMGLAPTAGVVSTGKNVHALESVQFVGNVSECNLRNRPRVYDIVAKAPCG